MDFQKQHSKGQATILKSADTTNLDNVRSTLPADLKVVAPIVPWKAHLQLKYKRFLLFLDCVSYSVLLFWRPKRSFSPLPFSQAENLEMRIILRNLSLGSNFTFYVFSHITASFTEGINQEPLQRILSNSSQSSNLWPSIDI